MNSIKRKVKFLINEVLYFVGKSIKKKPFEPIFIIGCGRSGTTILGETLSAHSSIYYLKETISIFIYNKCFPDQDIYFNTPSQKTKLILDLSDYDNMKSKLLWRSFHLQHIINRRPVFLEKMPLNIFRLEWLYKTFPNARFIYIKRNGLEVAKSISEKDHRWFGKNGIKWSLLSRYASEDKVLKNILPLVESSFEKGLLEWRIANNLAKTFFSKLSNDKYHNISYSDFMTNPQKEIAKVLDFIGLQNEISLDSFIKNKIKRKRKILTLDDFENPRDIAKIHG